MARRQPTARVLDTRVAQAKARLAAQANGGMDAAAAADRIAAQVRARPWRGLGVALGLGLALGLARGRGARTVGRVIGPFGAALVGGVLRDFALGASGPASALNAKVAEVRSRSAAR